MPKDQIVKLKKGTARVKPIKNLGKDEDGNLVQSQTIKSTEQVGKYKLKDKNVNRYVGGKLVSTDYVPQKMRVKKARKLKVKKTIPRKLKKVEVPSYTAPEVTLDEKDQKTLDRREKLEAIRKKKKKKKFKIKLPKIKRRPKARRTKNLVTGKWNYTK
jgi:hypothetical protein